MLLVIEAMLAAVAIVLSFIVGDLGSHWFERVESGFRILARKRRLSLLIVVVSALAARAVLFPILPVPAPQGDDEFSHLLLADTLLHGRLANPTPSMWAHFETFDVNMLPTYASVYPPVQGMFLATGKMLTGRYFVGVMFSVAVMCGAICWMLQGWMPAEWALLGGLLAVARFGMFTYWADSYWGGAPAAIGGALALGALPRIKRDFRARDAAILGLGLSVLANSRPYEGLLLSLPIGLTLLYWLFKQRSLTLRTVLARVVAPALIIVMIAGMATIYYFWRVTGNPLRSPYQVNWETYGMVPKFVWQSLRPNQEASLRHEALRDYYYVREYGTYTSAHTFKARLGYLGSGLVQDWVFYLGPLLSLPLFAAAATAQYGFTWKQLDAGTRFLLVAAATVSAGLALEVFSYPHYAAPITCVIIALVVSAMRHLRSQHQSDKSFGLFLTRSMPVVCVLMLVLRAAAIPLHIPLRRGAISSIYNADIRKEDTFAYQIEARLENVPGQHLVIVHYYAPNIKRWMGWVHNDADIDHSRIVWAWDMGAGENRELIDYFKGRHVWLVDAGDNPVLIPYPDEATR